MSPIGPKSPDQLPARIPGPGRHPDPGSTGPRQPHPEPRARQRGHLGPAGLAGRPAPLVAGPPGLGRRVGGPDGPGLRQAPAGLRGFLDHQDRPGRTAAGPGGRLRGLQGDAGRRLAKPTSSPRRWPPSPSCSASRGLASDRDPEAAVRKSLAVMVVPGTNLIEVAMASGSADEAAEDRQRRGRGLPQGGSRRQREAEFKGRRRGSARAGTSGPSPCGRSATPSPPWSPAGNVNGGQVRDRNSAAIERRRR